MEDLRLKKVEFDINGLKRKVSDHEELHKETAMWRDGIDKTIAEQGNLIAALQESTESVNHLREVVESAIEAFGWLAKFAKWVLTMAAFFTGCWALFRAIIARAHL